MVDPRADAPAYRQIADALRAEINAGRWAPGSQLPSAGDLARRFDVGVDAVRDAFIELRAEGLVLSVRRGARLVVREIGERTAHRLSRGARVILRMPTPDEKREHDIPDGVPVAVVTVKGQTWLYIGDRDELST